MTERINRMIDQQVARDLMEDGRCGRSHDIAKSFDIKVSDTDPFWKDRTFLELNFAVSGPVCTTYDLVGWSHNYSYPSAVHSVGSTWCTVLVFVVVGSQK